MLANRRWWAVAAVALALMAALGTVNQGVAKKPVEPADVGKFLYFDLNLSEPNGQACSSCHDPKVGFDDPDDNWPVSEGVIPGAFGGRNAPISAYAMYAPMFYQDADTGLWLGGQFWDGRATGGRLGDPLADQAIGPFLNPVEMHNPSEAAVIDDVQASQYADLFEAVWGADIWDNVLEAYDRVGWSIAAFERTKVFARFDSKYDAYLVKCLKMGGTRDDCAQGIGRAAQKAGRAVLTPQEWYGLQVFAGPNNNDGTLDPGEGANCIGCHVMDWTNVADYALPVVVPEWSTGGWIPPVFSDWSYDNLGVPVNDLLQPAPTDLGLGGVLQDPDEYGKFKVMTLREIGVSKPYAHNGYFTTLAEIVHFYNARDVDETIEAPEYPDTMNIDELGDLGLGPAEEAALVAFMETLTDGYVAFPGGR